MGRGGGGGGGINDEQPVLEELEVPGDLIDDLDGRWPDAKDGAAACCDLCAAAAGCKAEKGMPSSPDKEMGWLVSALFW